MSEGVGETRPVNYNCIDKVEERSDLGKVENGIRELDRKLNELYQLSLDTLTIVEHGKNSPCEVASKDVCDKKEPANRFLRMVGNLEEQYDTILRISQKLNKIQDLVK